MEGLTSEAIQVQAHFKLGKQHQDPKFSATMVNTTVKTESRLENLS